MHLRNHGVQNRRSRRHFHDRYFRPHPVGNRLEDVACFHGNGMTAAFTLILVLEHDQQVTFPGPLPQVVMPDHAVKIKWLRGTGVGLYCRDLGNLADRIGQLQRNVGRVRHGRTFGHVHNDRKFRLVVKRQHLHGNVLGIKRHTQDRRKTNDTEQEEQSELAAINQRHDDRSIETTDAIMHAFFFVFSLFQGVVFWRNLDRHPGRENKRGHQ